MLIIVFRSGLHSTPSRAKSIQTTSHHTVSQISILLLLIHLNLGLPSGLFPSGFPTNNLYTFLLITIRATFLSHLILLDLTIILGEEYKLKSSSLCSFLLPPVSLSLLGPNILLSTPFSNALTVFLS
jgi:hypothetical protein